MNSSLLSIQQVSQLTGVNPVTLRAWERRYGLLTPERTGKGHRRYRQQDVQRVKMILHWLDKGVAVSRVEALLDNNQRLADQEQEQAHWQELRAQAWQAIEHCQSSKLDVLLGRLLAEYGPAKVIRFFSMPLLSQLASSPLLEAQRFWFEALLQLKWAGRLLSLAPHREQFAWLVIPLGSVLQAQQVAMVVNRPLWCLAAAPSAQSLKVLLARRSGVGLLWVAERQWRLSEGRHYWPEQGGAPMVCWADGMPLQGVPEQITALHCGLEQLPQRLRSLERETLGEIN